MGNSAVGGAVCAVSPAVATTVIQASVLDIFSSRQGEGICVGDPHIFIRFGGCNLSCDYCDTPESIPARSGRSLTLEHVLERVAELDGGAAGSVVSLTGGEPLLHIQFLQHLVPALRDSGRRIYLETNGTLPRALEKIVSGCDWVSMDFKPDSATGQDSWEAHQWFLEMSENKVFVKLVLTDRTQEADFLRTIELIRRVRSDIPLILQPASPQGETGSVPLERLASWWRRASAQLSDVRILPQIHRLWGIP